LPDVAAPTEVRIRLPGSAYLPVVLLAVCVTPMVQHPAALPVYLIPLAALAYVVRTATIAGPDGVIARAVFGSVHVPWEDVRGLSTDDRGRVYLARLDDTLVRLPCTRARHLPLLALVSGGRLTAPA
jgi:Bacterial PH domain